MIGTIERGATAAFLDTIRRLVGSLDIPEAALFSLGPTVLDDSERTRPLTRIHAKLSRLNEDELARADRMLAALTD